MPARISQHTVTSSDRPTMGRAPPVSTRTNSSDIVSAMDGLRRAALDPPAHTRHRAHVSGSHIPVPRASTSELAAASKQHARSHRDMRRIPESRPRIHVPERESSKATGKSRRRSHVVADDRLRDARDACTVEGQVPVAGSGRRRHSSLASADTYEGMQQEAGPTHRAEESYRPPSANFRAPSAATGYARRTERHSDHPTLSGDDIHHDTQRGAGSSRTPKSGPSPSGASSRIRNEKLEQRAGDPTRSSKEAYNDMRQESTSSRRAKERHGPHPSSRHLSTAKEHAREADRWTEDPARSSEDIHDGMQRGAGSSRKVKETYGPYTDPRVAPTAAGRTKETRRKSDNPAPSILKRSRSIRSSSGHRRSRHCSARLSVAEAEARQAESLLDVQLDGISDQEHFAWQQEQEHFDAMRRSLDILLDATPGDRERPVRKHQQERIVSSEVTQHSPRGADEHQSIIDEAPPWSPRTSRTAGATATYSGEAASQGGEPEARRERLEFELPQVFVQVSDLPLRIQGILHRRGSRFSRRRSGSAASESVIEPMLHDDVARALSALRSPYCY